MATQQMDKAKAAMEAAKAESARKSELLEKRDKEWTALQKRLSALEKTVELLGAERDSLQTKLEQVSAETKEEAYKAIERDRKHLEKDAAERMEMLTDSLETLQATSSQTSSVGHCI
jgi:predicted  nucleic acid-binding Zn-ribbon protein